MKKILTFILLLFLSINANLYGQTCSGISVDGLESVCVGGSNAGQPCYSDAQCADPVDPCDNNQCHSKSCSNYSECLCEKKNCPTPTPKISITGDLCESKTVTVKTSFTEGNRSWSVSYDGGSYTKINSTGSTITHTILSGKTKIRFKCSISGLPSRYSSSTTTGYSANEDVEPLIDKNDYSIEITPSVCRDGDWTLHFTNKSGEEANVSTKANYKVQGAGPDGLDVYYDFKSSSSDFSITKTGIENATSDPSDDLQPGTTLTFGIANDDVFCSNTSIGPITVPASTYEDMVSVSVNSTDPTCYKANDGKVKVSISDGEGDYRYTLKSPDLSDSISHTSSSTTYEFTGLPAFTGGTVTVTDACNVTLKVADASVTLTEPELSIGALEVEDVTCHLGSDGVIRVPTPKKGGSCVLQYKLVRDSDGFTVGYRDSDSVFTGLEAGIYKAYVQVKGLSDSELESGSVTIDQPPALQIGSPTITHVSCYGGADGEAVIPMTSLGGSADDCTLEYELRNSSGVTVRPCQTSNTFSNLSQGTYRAYVRIQGINASEVGPTNVVINQPTELTMTSSNIDDVLCNGDLTGGIQTAFSGGVAPYTYQWRDGGGTILSETTASISNIGAGMYTIRVTDANGCILTPSFTVSEPPALVVQSKDSTHILCYGDNTGALEVTMAGGTLPYRYSIDGTNFQSSNSFTDLVAGLYTVTTQDSHNCEVITTVEVTQEPQLQYSADSTAVQCRDSDDATFTFTLINGTAPFTYSIEQGGVKSTAASGTVSREHVYANLAHETDYTFEAVDTYGCKISTSKSFVNPDLVLIDEKLTTPLAGNEVKCRGDETGSLQVWGSGGTGAYRYYLYKAGVLVDSTVNYHSGDTTFGDLGAGTYSLSIKDQNGCDTASSTYEIFQPDTLELDVIQTEDVICFGNDDGLFKVAAKGGRLPYRYVVNGDTSVATLYENLAPGTYRVSVLDDCDNEVVKFVDIDEPDLLEIKSLDVISDYNGAQLTCPTDDDGVIKSKVDGGLGNYTYVLEKEIHGVYSFHDRLEDVSQDSVIFNTEISAGNYRLILTDGNDCTDTSWVTVIPPQQLDATIYIDEVTCYGGADGALRVSVTGGTGAIEYSIDGGVTYQTDSVFGSLPIGTYTIYIRDVNKCEITRTETMVQPPLLRFNGVVDSVNCYDCDDGTVTFGGGGGRGGAYKYYIKPKGGVHFTDSIDTYVSNEHTFTGLGKGEYVVRIEDTAHCTLDTIVELHQPDSLSAGITLTQRNICNGDRNAILRLDVSGGVAPYQVIWKDKESNVLQVDTVYDQSTITGLADGTYRAYIQDKYGCNNKQVAGYFKQFTITDAPELILAVDTLTNLSCYQAGDGTVTLTGSGGWQETKYQYSIDGVNYSLDSVFQDLDAGIHRFYIKDFVVGLGECIVPLDVEVTEPDTLQAVIAQVDSVRCLGEANGKVTLDVSGGTRPYYISYDRVNWDEAVSVDGLLAGTYDMYIRDSLGCEVSLEATVYEPDTLAYDIVWLRNWRETEDPSGIKVAARGGTSPYTYQWKDEDGKVISEVDSATDLVSGLYSLTTTDSKGCVLIDTLTISSAIGPKIRIVDSGAVTCIGGDDGYVVLEVTGGAGPYEIRWINAQGEGRIAKNLRTGSYLVEVTDISDQKTYMEIVIPYQYLVSFEISYVNPKCYMSEDGYITVTSIGDVDTDYEFKWDNGEEGAEIENLGQGRYIVDINYGVGCHLYDTVDLVHPPELELTMSYLDPECFGLSQGSEIRATVKGGTPPYTYRWDDDTLYNHPSREELLGGTYILKVIDSNFCEISDTVTLYNPTPVETFSVDVDSASCFLFEDGQISLHTVGGFPPYTYNWKTIDGTALGQHDSVLTHIGVGRYQVDVADQNVCTYTDTFEVYHPEPLSITIEENRDISCYGGRDGYLSVEVNGGTKPYQYKWNNGSDKSYIELVPVGTYQVEVTDKNGCVLLSHEFTLESPKEFKASTAVVSDVSCYGSNSGTLSVRTSGGVAPYKVRIYGDTYIGSMYKEGVMNNSGSPLYIDQLPAGRYTVQVFDANECKVILDVEEITQPKPLTLHELTRNDPSCFGSEDGELAVYAKGGTLPYKYLWDHGDTVPRIDNIKKGSYQVKVTDAYGCHRDTAFELKQPTQMVAFASPTNVKCDGDADGSIDVTISGGTPPYTYEWSNQMTTQDIERVAAGTYDLITTDANRCQHSSSFGIGAPDPIVIEAAISDPTCYNFSNGSINVEVKGGTPPYNYTWGNGVTQPSNPNLTEGKYVLQILDDNQCKASESYELEHPDLLEVSLVESVMPLCNGDANGHITVAVKGGTPPYSYQWDNGATDSINDNITSGNYELKITDAQGCILIDNFTLSQPTPLMVQTNPTDLLCFGYDNGQISSEATGGTSPYTYQWSHGPSTKDVTNLIAGTYNLTTTDANACTYEVETTVTEPPLFDIDVGKDIILCKDQTEIYDFSSQNVQYQWASPNGFNSNENKVTISQGGTYYVTAINPNQCVARDTLEVELLDQPIQATFLMLSEVYTDETSVLIDISWPYPETIKWELAAGLPIANQSDSYVEFNHPTPGTYDVTLSTTLGLCEASTTKQLEVLPASSRTRRLNTSNSQRIVEVSAYPNPINERLSLDVELGESTSIRVNVVSTNGTKMIPAYATEPQSIHHIEFDTSGWSHGIYLVTVEAGTDLRIIKIIKN